MTSKSEIQRIIAEIDSGCRIMPAVDQRRAATRLMLAERAKQQDEFLALQAKEREPSADPDYGYGHTDGSRRNGD